jgi:hypothetical protein
VGVVKLAVRPKQMPDGPSCSCSTKGERFCTRGLALRFREERTLQNLPPIQWTADGQWKCASVGSLRASVG